MTQHHDKGFLAGIFCFVFWGLAPIYFKQLETVSALNIIAHRVIWSVLFLLLFLTYWEKNQLFRTLYIPFKTMLALLLSGIMIISNWLIFVWAVTHDQILATSLGYFINPLMNVLFGMLFLKESLNKVQTAALLMAATGTVYLGWYLGQPPWLALLLAVTFALYSLIRKKTEVRPLIGLLWESGWLLVPALVFLLLIGDHTAWHQNMAIKGWLIGTGLITIIPLIAFNYAAKQLRLSTLGFLQYIAPTLSFTIAVLFYNEPLTKGHQVAFACIWTGLIIMTTHNLKHRKRQ